MYTDIKLNLGLYLITIAVYETIRKANRWHVREVRRTGVVYRLTAIVSTTPLEYTFIRVLNAGTGYISLSKLRKYFMSQGNEKIVRKLTKAKLRGQAKRMASGEKKGDL
jgi:hypothetical protein